MSRLFESLRCVPLAHKILIINGVVVLACGLLTLGMMVTDQYRAARAQWMNGAQLATSLAGPGLADAIRAEKPSDARAVLNSLLAGPNVLGAAVFNARKESLVSSGYSLEFPRILGAEGADAATTVTGDLESHASLTHNGKLLGTLVIRADERGLYRQVIEDAYPLLAMAASGVAVLMLMLWMLIPMALRRLRHLAGVIGAVARDGDYTVRAQVRGTDEIGQLARAFNSMLDQIQARDEKLHRELSERRRAQKQTAYVANHDPVTGLPNRRFFADALRHALANRKDVAQHLAVMIVDIDHFKGINDSLGHAAGDHLLAELGNRLRREVREGDFVCRLGGDEFGVVLDSVANQWQATELGDRVMQAILKPFVLEGREVSVGSSAGIAFALKETSAEELLRNAETALHEAKASGKGTLRLFRAYMSDRVQQRLSLEQALKKALEQEQFTLHYQPQVDTVTGGLLSVEALVRWRHPKLGNIPPAQFIPLAEETGIIIALGTWVMERASADARAWQAQGLSGVAVSVNVSARQFLEAQFVATVLRTLRQANLRGDLLELEFTESMLFDRAGAHGIELVALRDQGVSLAIDDFGTGYSSMAYLKRFPVQRLKIDRSFIKNIPYESDDMAIASAVIALGHKMGLEVVAEGVETLAQYEYLKQQACDRIQGYLFSKPLSLEDLLAKYAMHDTPSEDEPQAQEPELVFAR